MARGFLHVTCIVSTCVCLLQRFVPAAAVMMMAMQGPVLDYKTACAHLKLIKKKTVKKTAIAVQSKAASERKFYLHVSWFELVSIGFCFACLRIVLRE